MKAKIIIAAILLFGQVANAQINLPNITNPSLDFSLPSLQKDSTIQLSSLKGKVFLLDFWASWCAPCRAANKQLLKLYAKYKDAGFEILGVSLDENSIDWKKAIAKDKITWLQVIDKNGWDAIAAMKWNIEAIPSSFLIDKNGNVVASDLTYSNLEKMIKQLLELN